MKNADLRMSAIRLSYISLLLTVESQSKGIKVFEMEAKPNRINNRKKCISFTKYIPYKDIEQGWTKTPCQFLPAKVIEESLFSPSKNLGA